MSDEELSLKVKAWEKQIEDILIDIENTCIESHPLPITMTDIGPFREEWFKLMAEVRKRIANS